MQESEISLRDKLIDTGLKLLLEGGPEALTLRKCAQLAGVSHAAPAHHFAGLRGLKTAMVGRGHEIFAQMMRNEMDAAPKDKNSQILAICQGYIQFSQQYRHLFNLMFVPPAEFAPDPARDDAAKASRDVLTALCKQHFPGPNQHFYEIAIWSLVHGYSKLLEIGRVQPGSQSQADIEFAQILKLLDFPGTQ